MINQSIMNLYVLYGALSYILNDFMIYILTNLINLINYEFINFLKIITIIYKYNIMMLKLILVSK